MKTNHYITIIKYGLTAIALINLILLFVFHYEIPSGIKDKLLNRNKHTEELYFNSNTKEPDAHDLLNIILDTETLTYDGTAALDLLSGVAVTDKNGDPVELDIYSSIQGTDDPNKKIITYSVRDEEGNEAIAERELLLHNYYGPALSVSQPFPEITDVELDHILEIFLEKNLLSANDGYDKNITSAIQCSYKVADEKARKVDITFTVTNHFKDKVTETITAPISRTKPLIVLADTSVTIKKGESIDPLSYVVSATNEEGQDLISKIKLDGDVNTAAAGNYTITYTLTDSDQEQADPVELTVVVEE